MAKASHKRKKEAARKRAVTPSPKKSGNDFGKALADTLLKGMGELAKNKGQHFSDPLPTEPATVGLEVPHAQNTTVIAGNLWAQWRWYPYETEYPHVSADFNLHTGKYWVTIELGQITKLAGNSERTKQMALALLSAAEWEESWKTVLGLDTSKEQWMPYVRMSQNKPRHARD